MKNRLKRFFVFFVVMVFISTFFDSYSYANQICTEKSFLEDGYTAFFSLDYEWLFGFNASVTIENTGESSIENWYILLVFDNQIDTIWNAEIVSYDERGYIIKNCGWNQDIQPGESITFGISSSEAFKGTPKSFKMCNYITFVEKEDYGCDFSVESDWNSGFCAEITVSNHGKSAIEDWVIEFDYDRNVINLWNGDIIQHDNHHYVVKNTYYNAYIFPGESITIGFIGEGDSSCEPYNIILKETVCNEKMNSDQNNNSSSAVTDNNVLEETTKPDSDSAEDDDNSDKHIFIDENSHLLSYEGFDGFLVVDKIGDLTGKYITGEVDVKSINVYVTAGYYSVPQNSVCWYDGIWLLSDIQLLIGDNEIIVEYTDVDDITEKFSIHVYNSSDDNSSRVVLDKNDDDKDGLKNYQEEQYGTDPLNVDTDGDSFFDYDEVFILLTDPCVYDLDEDFDNDGLYNSEEIKNSTNAYSYDTDNDELNDYDELKIFKTNPLVADTDGDGITDSYEMKYGFNPVVAEKTDDDGNVLLFYSMQDKDEISASVMIKTLPQNVNSFEMTNIPEDDCSLSNKIPGYLGEGCAYDLHIDGGFKEAELCFRLDDNIINGENFIPGVYYFDEDKYWLEEVENIEWDGNVITAHLTHFSKYIILDKSKYGNVWKYNLSSSETKNTRVDVVFAIDNSISMQKKDVMNFRRSFVKKCIECMNEKDRVGIVFFQMRTNRHIRITHDKTEVLKTSYTDNGDVKADLAYGLNAAIDRFEDDKYIDIDNDKVIILLTDDNAFNSDKTYNSDYPYKSNAIERAISHNITIYTIGVGNITSDSTLQEIASSTGGEYAHSSLAEKLLGIFERNYDISEMSVDTDFDGISDYYEKAMAAGNLRLGTGVSLLDVDYRNPDSDGDSLKDGEEIYISTSDRGALYVIMKSDPTKADTDEDGVNDSVDPWRLINHSFETLRLYKTGEEWGESLFDPNEDGTEKIDDPVDYYDTVVIHHTTRNQYEDIKKLEKNEKKDGFNGIPYHFVIDGNGTIFQGRPIDYKGAHVKSNNTGKIGVALMGNFEPTAKDIRFLIKKAMPTTPTKKQYSSMKELLKVLKTQYGYDYIGGHRDFVVENNRTDCPGQTLYDMLKDDNMILLLDN